MTKELLNEGADGHWSGSTGAGRWRSSMCRSRGVCPAISG